MTEVRVTIVEFCAATGLSPRTVHYYVSQGLLPRPHGVRRWATYGDEHLKRWQEIRRVLIDGRVTIAELAERFASA